MNLHTSFIQILRTKNEKTVAKDTEARSVCSCTFSSHRGFEIYLFILRYHVAVHFRYTTETTEQGINISLVLPSICGVFGLRISFVKDVKEGALCKHSESMAQETMVG